MQLVHRPLQLCDGPEEAPGHLAQRRQQEGVERAHQEEHGGADQEEGGGRGEQEATAVVVTLDQEEENEEDQLPVDFAKEEDVQEFFKLKGEKLIEAISKVEPKKVDFSLSFEEVMVKLASIKKDIDQLEIPDVEETQLKAEFEANRRTSIKKIEPKSSKPPTRTTMFLCPR